ncbi:hypothetical protein C922_05365 [Plasmodium inui San Antonio 1]|uniref:Uncharacterized protein n=1 Tax=Plasmodium inui San Antonio 1 TaxID=1237626 RepID=W6ZY74_9APIC|nr:hypothetical protein C922_05365 [Plasmodium inui San Antonio 1]EUD64250.1 hypothetical protein C922_05365 [Plasmodium inui San Antonio 1]
MRHYIPDSSFGKVIRLYRKDKTDYAIHETTNNTSGKNFHKEKREVHNHEVCVLTDEVIHTELSIPLFMMLLDEYREQ